MSDYELIVRSRSPEGWPLALAISEGVIQERGEEIQASGAREIEAMDAMIWPGWIDAHVHFNEPGRTEWEGIASGSRALAAGGGTAFIDMPLNSSPPVLDAEAFQEKRRLAEAKSCLDFGLWGGLVPASLIHIEAMADCGAAGLKAFMCPSGLAEFSASDPPTLKQGMGIAAERCLPVAVHAELEPKERPVGSDMKAWLAWRPIEAEVEAIRIALDLAGETGCALHIVHVSSPEGIDAITEAKRAGVDVTAETCPHYLLLDAEEAVAIGTLAKCAPPLRPKGTVEALRKRVREGEVDTLGSDHSPSSPDLKKDEDVFACWGGIAGIQDGLPLLMDEGLARPELLAEKVAQRFRFSGKGALVPGREADFSLVREEPREISASHSLTRHPHSPYRGRVSRHRICETFLRGERVSESTRGRFLRPSPR
ncbi:MAG: allantoinase AllB [Verrucomicrobiota bacterium]